MRWIVIIVGTFTIAVIARAATVPPPHIERALRLAVARYDVPYSWLNRVSWCESRWKADPPHNNTSRGLFQFQPGTWASTPYRRLSMVNARASALAAGWMYEHGRAAEWVCK